MKTLTLIIALFITAALPAPAFAERESAYERVMRTNAIRCGYCVWPPIMMRDPNTGELSGIFYEYMNALGESLSLDIEWTEETDWTSFGQALESGRIDGFCCGIWPSGARAREMDFSIPIYYNIIQAYARADDTRFDGALEKINDPSVIIATVDGEASNGIAASDFPEAEVLAAPQMMGNTASLVNVAEGKADTGFTDSATLTEYMEKNPDTLKVISGGEVIRYFGNTIAIRKNEYPLKALLDTGTRELMQKGVIERIIKKYERYPGTLQRVAKPYEATPQ